MAKLRNQKLVTQSRLIEKVFFFLFFLFRPVPVSFFPQETNISSF